MFLTIQSLRILQGMTNIMILDLMKMPLNVIFQKVLISSQNYFCKHIDGMSSRENFFEEHRILNNLTA